MGEIGVFLKLYSPSTSIELEALVDTAATFTKIPRAIATRLGLEAKYETSVELANGRIITRELALAEIEVEGVRRPVLVTIGGNEEKPLLGYTSLEALGFKVNPLTRKLEKAVAMEY